MKELYTDGTHLIATEGEYTLPMICAITGNPIAQQKHASKPNKLHLEYYENKFPWRPIALVFFILFVAGTIRTEWVTTPLIYLFSTSLVIFIMVATFFGSGSGLKSITLNYYIAKKIKYLTFTYALYPLSFYPIWFMLQKYGSSSWIHTLYLPILLLMGLLILYNSPTQKIKIINFHNNLLHITGIHPNLLKTLPKHPPASSLPNP